MASTTRQNYEQLSYRGPSGAMWTSRAQEIIGDAVATRTLVPKESGALCLMDRSTGVVYTLPSPVIGMTFEFATTVTIASGAAKIITNLATEFLLGDLQMCIAAAATTLFVAGNGTTTGGVQGDYYKITALSTTQWLVTGFISGSGALATPFATS